MNSCPGERSLTRLFAGAGTAAERAHLVTCDACRTRAAAIARDVDRIAIVLRAAAAEERPRSRAHREGFGARRWWPAFAGLAAAAAIAALLPSTLPDPDPVGSSAARGVVNEGMRASVRDLSQAMFHVGEPRAVPVPQRRSPAELVSAALAGWPCGDGESFAVSCP